MSNDIKNSKAYEIEKQVIIDIEEEIGYKFNILDKEEFFYAFRPIFYSLLELKNGWPPNNDKWQKYQDIEDKCLLAIVIESDHITGLSIQDDPRTPIKISQLPKSFKNLKFLKYLVIGNRHIINIHQFLEHLSNLEFLSLANTRLVYESGIFNNLKNLKGLDLGYYSRNIDLIKEVCKITSLQILDLSRTNLKVIPDCFHNLSNLKILDLSDKNDLQSFPKNLKELNNLEILILYKVGIAIIPEDIQLPQNLKEINLKFNHFPELPNNFEDLPKLEKIQVDGDVIANYIRKTKTELYNEFQKDVKDINFHILYSLTRKKKTFLDLLLENGFNYEEALHIHKDLLPPIKIGIDLDFIDSEEERDRKKAFKILLNNDLRDIKSLHNDLKWICENQITIKKVVLEEDDKKRIVKLGRLNIFVGKNNSGKTYALKQLYDKIRKITPEEDMLSEDEPRDFSGIEVEKKGEYELFKEGVDCFYIPKSRIYNDIVTQGERKGFEKSLSDLLDNFKKLQSEADIWSFDKIIEVINFFNSTDEEISELESSSKKLFNEFRLILKKWLDALHLYFPDIDLKLPKRSDFNTVYEFDCKDAYIPSLSYNFNELGSGMQELSVLMFFIELLKYLPQIRAGKIMDTKEYHRMLFIDEPDLSLHPELQEKFFNYLINASQRIQIILTTQSPFIPKPVENHISIKLFRKDTTGFHFDEITNNNFVLIQEELFRYQPLEIALYLSKNNYEYFKKLDYKSEEVSMGLFTEKRYCKDKNYLGLLRLGTVNWNMEDRILQNAYFLSFNPKTVDLNDSFDVEQNNKKSLRVFIVQLNKIPDEERKKLIDKCNKNLKSQNSILRLFTLCTTVWDKEKLKDFILHYNTEQQNSVSEKIRQYLKEIEEDIIENKSLILFSENTLPYAILLFLLDYSKKNKVVIIGGMEHCTLGNFNKIIDNLKNELRERYKDPINYMELEVDNLIDNDTYLNQAVVINADKSFTFQIKNLPVYFNSIKRREGIPIILKPLFKKIQTVIGNIAVLICKDLLVNSAVIDTWMDIHDIKILATPSFTNLVNPFRNKLGEIISNKKQKDKIFIFANISEYGGSGAYSYVNRRDFEPNRKSLFPFCYEIKEEEFRHSIESWRKKDFTFH